VSTPTASTVATLFAARASDHPRRPAIRSADRDLDYGALRDGWPGWPAR